MTDIMIYLSMLVLLVLAFTGLDGTGLIKLIIIKNDLKHAVRKTLTQKEAKAARELLEEKSGNFSSQIFRSKPLRRQLRAFQRKYNQINRTDKEKHSKGERSCDIEDFINYDFLDKTGNRTFCEHAANGLTALGVLGTFVGLQDGLHDFNTSSADEIVSGITGLLSGMSVAFLTSIVGIVLSLGFGVLYRMLFSRAEFYLDDFLDLFRENIVSDQSEVTENQIAEALAGIAKTETELKELLVTFCDGLSFRNKEPVEQMKEAFTAFLDETLKERQEEFRRFMRGQLDLSKELYQKIAESGDKIIAMLEAVDKATETAQKQTDAVQTALQTYQEIAEQARECYESILEQSEQAQSQAENLSQNTERALQAVNNSAVEQIQAIEAESSAFAASLQQQNQDYVQMTTKFLETALKVMSARLVKESSASEAAELKQCIQLLNQILNTMEQKQARKGLLGRFLP